MLVAISIPIFTTQLEKSREATDMANIRAAYAEVAASALADPDTAVEKTVKLKQTQTNWQTDNNTEIAGCKITDIIKAPKKDGSVKITYTSDAAGGGTIKIGEAKVPSTGVTKSNTTGSGE